MILITGGMGFIGLHTARAMLDAGEDVVITYYQTWREPDFIKDEFGGRVQVEKVDVTDREGLLALGEKHDITSICHLAVTGLGAFDAIGDMRVNLTGLMNVMEAGVQWGVSRVSLASSIAIYSSVPEGPFREDMPLPIYATGNPTETYKKTFEVVGGHVGARSNIEVIQPPHRRHLGAAVPLHGQPAEPAGARSGQWCGPQPGRGPRRRPLRGG